MAKETIDRIRSAEQRTGQAEKAARSDAELRLRQAAADAEKLIGEKTGAAREAAEAEVRKARREAEDKLRRADAETDGQILLLRQNAGDRRRAVGAVLTFLTD